MTDSTDEVALPLVSVIVATNRVSPFLAEALGSLTAQTYSNLEIIVVDDGSPDPVLIDSAAADAAPSARVIHRAHAGVSAARNVGVNESEGTLLVFVDDDDRCHPERISRQVSHLMAQPDAVAAYCGLRTIDAAGDVLVEADQAAVRDHLDVARRRTGILLPNLMVRRVDFEAVGGFDESLSLAEDLELVLNLSERGRFAFVPETLSDYRTHGANTTARHRELVESIDHIVKRHLSAATAAGDQPLAAAHRESLRANRRFAWWGAARAARIHLRDGRLATAASHILWAARFAPTAPIDAVGRRLRGNRV